MLIKQLPTFKKSALALALAAGTAMAAGTTQASDVEVLHWWTSGGEARAANVLKELLEAEGYGWQDFAVAGGGGETAMTLNEVADAEGWNDLLPEIVADIMRYDGQYVAVPANVHRVNWLWANPDVLEAAGVEMPTTLDELFAAGEAIREAGFVPLAHGGQSWQDATVFESVVLGQTPARADGRRHAGPRLEHCHRDGDRGRGRFPVDG